jgi:hypothetical protein
MSKEKVLIFDAGPLINLSMNGLLYILEELKKEFPGKFLITKQVKYETLDRPLKIQRFELGALRISKLLKDKVLETPESLGISDSEISKKTSELKNDANHLLQANGKMIEIVSDGEISCLALSAILNKKGIETMIAIDERTTRLLSENPKDLEKTIARKTRFPVKLSNSSITSLKKFKDFRFIRSPELVYVAHKKDLLNLKDPRALEASLYATKFKGSSVSWDEIHALRKM